jgi:hypothetical protein
MRMFYHAVSIKGNLCQITSPKKIPIMPYTTVRPVSHSTTKRALLYDSTTTELYQILPLTKNTSISLSLRY